MMLTSSSSAIRLSATPPPLATTSPPRAVADGPAPLASIPLPTTGTPITGPAQILTASVMARDPHARAFATTYGHFREAVKNTPRSALVVPDDERVWILVEHDVQPPYGFSTKQLAWLMTVFDQRTGGPFESYGGPGPDPVIPQR